MVDPMVKEIPPDKIDLDLKELVDLDPKELIEPDHKILIDHKQMYK
jgi:hemin uptake protein HemP